MKTYRVTFSELARRQLFEIYDYIAEHADPVTALRYVERIEAYCRGFSTIAERGTLREDLRPGLRLVGFERRATIAIAVTGDQVVILQILYGGRNVDELLNDNK